MSFPRGLRTAVLLTAATFLSVSAAGAQDFTVDDPVVTAIYEIGIDQSQLESLAQALLDSIGPRLAGTPQYE